MVNALGFTSFDLPGQLLYQPTVVGIERGNRDTGTGRIGKDLEGQSPLLLQFQRDTALNLTRSLQVESFALTLNIE